MTRLHDVTVGQFDQFKRNLAAAGMNGEMISALNDDPEVTAGMVEWAKNHLHSSMFVSLEKQLANLQRWNKRRDWGFVEADFAAIDLTPSERYDLVVDVIVAYLPDKDGMSGVQRTFEEYWAVAHRPRLGKWRDPRVQSDPMHLRLTWSDHTPGIRRIKLDLGAFWGDGASRKLVVKLNSAHAEVLAAAAHFPKWVEAMDGRKVPYVCLRGYELKTDKYFGSLVGLDNDCIRGLALNVIQCDDTYTDTACPVVLD